ncbi:MAG: trypsin-like serine protease [Bdellovibrio sp.]|nr:trypsin-like serine protease [Bdellovibrio sp.]
MLKSFCAAALSLSTLMLSIPGHAIVGGQKLEVLDGLRESTVLLYIYSKDSNRICTGTLIAKDLVLTAGHCTADESLHEEIAVGFGVDSEDAFTENGKIKTYGTVVRSAVVDEYDRNQSQGSHTVQYDLAILQFKGSLPKEAKVRALPEAGYSIPEKSVLILSGYGLNDEMHPDESALRAVGYSAGYLAEAVYDEAQKKAYQFPSAIIVEQPHGGVCEGDSGGPLLVQDGDKLTMVGVASYALNPNATVKDGSQRCRGSAAFVDVRKNLGWIQAAIAALKN